VGDGTQGTGFGRGAGEAGPDPARRHGWEAVRYALLQGGILLPLAIVVLGVVLDRAGFSAVGITLTFLGGVAFVVLLCLVALWG
jgi:hypothetical protein